MKKLTLVLLSAALFLNIAPQAGLACSDFLLNNSGSSVVSARSMDFGIPLQAEVVVVPSNLIHNKFPAVSFIPVEFPPPQPEQIDIGRELIWGIVGLSILNCPETVARETNINRPIQNIKRIIFDCLRGSN